MPSTTEKRFDSIVVDKDNLPVALVEVRAYSSDKWPKYLSRETSKFPPFVFTVDPNHISLYRPAGDDLGAPIVQLNTRRILQQYDPEFPERRVFEQYLTTLVEAWLRDLAYHWNSEKPPGSDELAKTGLLEKLEGGTTQRFGD
jgi:hypothetical protein